MSLGETAELLQREVLAGSVKSGTYGEVNGRGRWDVEGDVAPNTGTGSPEWPLDSSDSFPHVVHW